MSASWCSERGRALGAVLVALGLAIATVASAATPDSARAKRSVLLDAGGLRVERSGSAGEDVQVSVGPGGVKVTRAGTDSARGDVEILGDGGLVVVSDSDAGLVRVFADAEVAADERIEGDVVAVFGSVRVLGTVTGSVVAVGGSVELEPGASVEGDAVAIGGLLHQADGASVGGEGVTVGFLLPPPLGLPPLPAMLLTVLGGWLLTLVSAGLLALLFGERMARIAETASRRSGVSFLLGLVLLPLTVVAMMLLFVTVIGIPLALLLPFLYVLLVWAGQVAATAVLGAKLMRRRAGEGGIFTPVALGSLFVAGFFLAGALLATPPGVARTASLFFSILGVLLVFGLTTIGSGAVLVSRFGAPAGGGRPSEAPAPGASSATPLPGPA